MIAQLASKLVAVWKYALLCALFALLQCFAFFSFIQASHSSVIADAIGFALLYFVLAILLYYTIRYGQFHTLALLHQVLIYTALTALSLVVLYGAAYVFYQLLPVNDQLVFNQVMPLRMLISALIISIIIQHCHQCKGDLTTQSTPSTPDLDLTNTAQPRNTPELLQRVTVKWGSKIQVVPTADILSVLADGDYVQIHTLTGKFMKEQTMKYFEENLPADLFARVHRSCIVNIHAIARIELYDKQSQQLTLKNGQQVKVSQAGYKLLRSKLML
jgi:LytTr DNA-binding domain